MNLHFLGTFIIEFIKCFEKLSNFQSVTKFCQQFRIFSELLGKINFCRLLMHRSRYITNHARKEPTLFEGHTDRRVASKMHNSNRRLSVSYDDLSLQRSRSMFREQIKRQTTDKKSICTKFFILFVIMRINMLNVSMLDKENKSA